MIPTGAEERRASRLRSAGPLLALMLAGLAGAFLAAARLDAWREREREARLRRSHTLDGIVDRHPEFRSALLGNVRSVSVYQPLQYLTDEGRRFPVLYVQDGQNVFDGATADLAGEEWQLDETLERLIGEERIAPLIVVAIDSLAARRVYEYTPSRDPGRGEGGGADAYGRMVVEELKPWIDSTYRTQPGRDSTFIAGGSLGGLVSLCLALRYPDVFARAASLSTAAAWDDGFIARCVDALPEKPETAIWIDVGTAEGPASLTYSRKLRDALLRKGWREGEDLRYLEVAGAQADAASWARRLPEVLVFLSPPGTTGTPSTSAPR